MFEYLGGPMELRRREPGEDVISDLLAGADGDTLSDHEITSICRPVRHHASPESAHRVRRGDPRVHRSPALGLEMRLALASVVKRLPGLRFAEAEPELRWVPSLASRGLETLRVAHDAQA